MSDTDNMRIIPAKDFDSETMERQSTDDDNEWLSSLCNHLDGDKPIIVRDKPQPPAPQSFSEWLSKEHGSWIYRSAVDIAVSAIEAGYATEFPVKREDAS